MSNNIGIARIDTIALTEQLNKMKEERNKLKSLFDIVNKNTNYLKEYWDSRTSESVFNNFEEMYKGYQGLLNDLNRDIAFLERTINDYLEYENKASKEIDTNITA